MHKLMGCLVASALLLAPPVFAADYAILGKQLTIADPTGAEEDRSVALVAKETSTDVPALGDPTIAGAVIDLIVQGGTASGGGWVLPAAGWTRTGTTWFRYRSGPGADAAPVKQLTLSRSSRGTLVLKLKLAGSVGTASLGVVPPNPGTAALLSYALNQPDADRHCVAFGGPAGGQVKVDTPRKWKIVTPTSAPGCTALETTTTTTTTTTTLPSLCGNGVIDAGEQCDGEPSAMCLGYECAPPGQQGECECCGRGTVPIVGSPTPVCCTGGEPMVPWGPSVGLCPHCTGQFPACGGAGCSPGETCLPVVYWTPNSILETCECSPDGRCGTDTCAQGEVCVVHYSAGTGCAQWP